MIDTFDRELTNVEQAIYEAYLQLADGEGDWVRLAKLRPLVPYHHDDVTAALLDLERNGDAVLAECSNRKVRTDEDRAAEVWRGRGLFDYPLNLIAFYGPDDFEG